MLQRKVMLGLVAGLFFLSGGVSFADISSEKTPEPKMVSVDTNKDAKPDRFEYHDGSKVRVEADTNFDGKVDEIAYFEEGKLVKGEKDSDYDGKMDKWINY